MLATVASPQLYLHQCRACRATAVTSTRSTGRVWRCNTCGSWLVFIESFPVKTQEHREWHARGIVYNPGAFDFEQVCLTTDGPVLNALTSRAGPTTVVDLCAQLPGFFQAQVRAALFRLQQRGLAERTDAGWIA